MRTWLFSILTGSDLIAAPETHLNIKTVEDDLKIIEDKLAEALAAVKKIESPVSIVAVSVGLSVRVTLPDVQADVARLCNVSIIMTILVDVVADSWLGFRVFPTWLANSASWPMPTLPPKSPSTA